jgi:hypothetical protein
LNKNLDDTVSDEEYGTESDDGASKSEKKDTDNSKYSHSRFSSQIEGDLDDLNLDIGEIGQGISPINNNIDDADI